MGDLLKKSDIVSFGVKKVGVAAKAAEAAKNAVADITLLEHRIIILADDSGSMGTTGIANAKKAISEFLKVSSPTNTAIGIWGFHRDRRWNLTTDFISLELLKEALAATESTPIYTTLDEIIEKENITRIVLFSDGSPTDGSILDANETTNSFQTIQKYIQKKIPIDTVYICEGDSEELKKIAELTGGLYLVFKDAGTFAKNFKYLAPAYRGLLMDSNFRKEIGV